MASPLQSGLIRFVPVDGRTPTAEATITDGEFSGKSRWRKAGFDFLAESRWQTSAYQTPNAPMIDIIEELLPARYNVTSELTLNVDGATSRQISRSIKPVKRHIAQLSGELRLLAYLAARPLRAMIPITFGNTCRPLRISPQSQTRRLWRPPQRESTGNTTSGRAR